MKLKKVIMSVVVSASLALSVFGAAVPGAVVEAAAKGPKTGSESYAHIAMSDSSSEDYKQWYLYRSENLINNSDEAELYSESDMKYSKKTNTLTLNNFNHPTYSLAINQMGDDFKLVLKGKNSVQNIGIYGDYYGGSVAIKGSGSLTCNKNKKSKLYGAGIILGAENTASKITIAKTCTITAFCNKYASYDTNTYEEITADGHPIYVFANTIKKPAKIIKSAGKVSGGKFKTEKSSVSGCYDSYCTASKYVSKKK